MNAQVTGCLPHSCFRRKFAYQTTKRSGVRIGDQLAARIRVCFSLLARAYDPLSFTRISMLRGRADSVRYAKHYCSADTNLRQQLGPGSRSYHRSANLHRPFSHHAITSHTVDRFPGRSSPTVAGVSHFADVSTHPRHLRDRVAEQLGQDPRARIRFTPCALGPDWRKEPRKHSFEYPVSAGQGPRPWPKAENSPSG